MRWIRPMVASVGATKSAEYQATASSSATPSVASPYAPAFCVCIACAAEVILNPNTRGFLTARADSLLQQIFAEKPGHRQKDSIKRGQHPHPNGRQRGRVLEEARRRFGTGDQRRGQQRGQEQRQKQLARALLRRDDGEDRGHDT